VLRLLVVLPNAFSVLSALTLVLMMPEMAMTKLLGETGSGFPAGRGQSCPQQDQRHKRCGL
ncbi:MAG: hypothetical protein KGM87_12415, partial [Betaproteobacteria bacterium]|nr:hypothetical protein [Betaproteobacteria bacterium]